MTDSSDFAGVIESAGLALYGPRWRSPLARELQRPGAGKPGVDLRLLQHWLAKTPGRKIPAWVPGAVTALLRAKSAAPELAALANQLEAIPTASTAVLERLRDALIEYVVAAGQHKGMLRSRGRDSLAGVIEGNVRQAAVLLGDWPGWSDQEIKSAENLVG